MQPRIELFFKFVAYFDLIDKEISKIYYKRVQLINFNDKSLVKLNYFTDKIIQLDDFQTIIKLELVFQQKVFISKNFSANEFNSVLSIYLNLQKKLLFYFLELQLYTLFLAIGLSFFTKKILLDKKIIIFLCLSSNSCFSYFLLTKLKEYNIKVT